MLAITTMSLIYINLMCQNKYIYVTSISSLVFAVYYIVKSITIYKINKKKYFMDRMKEIIDKDNEEKCIFGRTEMKYEKHDWIWKSKATKRK